jgi:hypothetical protein
MKSNTRIPFTLAVTGLLAAAPAMSKSALPPLQTQGGVAFLSGGIGSDESLAIRKVEPKFPLTLEFVQQAKPRPEYLADVAVTITDHHGHTVLNTLAEGPFLLARLAPGDYTVVAEQSGLKKTQHLEIAPKKTEKKVFEWTQ